MTFQIVRKNERRTGPDTANMVVIIIKARYRQQKFLIRLHAVSQSVGEQFLRNKVRPARQKERGFVRKVKLPIDAGRISDRARDRAQKGLPLGGRPGEARAGLIFEAGVSVMLELRSQRQMQPIFHERDFILHKTAGEMKCFVAGQESKPSRNTADVVFTEPITSAPYEIISMSQGKPMLQIEIVGIQILFKRSGNFAPGLVII